MDGLGIIQPPVTVPTAQILRDALAAGHSGGRRLVPRPNSMKLFRKSIFLSVCHPERNEGPYPGYNTLE